MKTHIAIKSNKCSQCDYASSQAGDLRTHMKTHTGEKSNKCSQRDYASSLAFNLKTHMKTHTRGKSNCQAGNLKTHMKRHNRNKPFLIWFYFEFCVFIALGTSWTTYQCQLFKLKFIMYGGNLTLTHSHHYHYWHFPTMVGLCHGGNMLASHYYHYYYAPHWQSHTSHCIVSFLASQWPMAIDTTFLTISHWDMIE